MTLRSRLAAIERAARRRRWRHPAAMVSPVREPILDMDDPETVAVLSKLAELRQRAASDHPIDTARLAMEDPDFAARVRAVIRKGMAAADASPVSETGESEHEG